MAAPAIFGACLARLAACGFLLVAGPALSAADAPVVIKGSNTFGEELAPALIRHYNALHPTATVTLESRGSETGIAALLAGDCDIASSSRRINDDEHRLARSRGLKLKVYLIGFYGVAVIVHRENPVTELTDQQVRDIFTGRTSSWQSLGGGNLPIRRYIRDPASGTYLGFQELAMAREPYSADAKRLQSYDEIAAAVAQDRAAIGYVSMSAANHTGVAALRINRVPISVLTVNAEDYPYARALRLITVEGREPPGVLAFLQFVLSSKGQAVLAGTGFVGRYEPPLVSPEW